MAAATTTPSKQQLRVTLEPLTSVAVVLRSCSGELEALPHVVSLVSAFLDGATPKRWSFERACERGLGLWVLKRLVAHEKINNEASDPASSPPMDPFYRAFLASKGLVAAIRRADDLDVARWICCEYCPSVVPVNAIGEATLHGRLRVLQWLFERYPSVQPNQFVVNNALRGGQVDVFEWLLPRLETIGDLSGLISWTAGFGHFEMLRWLHELRFRSVPAARGPESNLDRSALGSAIARGNFEAAKYLAEHRYTLEDWQRRSITSCADSGNLEMIKWVHAQELMDAGSSWIDRAVSSGHLHIVKWIHENLPGACCSMFAMSQAARFGYLEVMQWLHANRTESCTRHAMNVAAENGHLDVVQWLHANRTEGCTTDAMDGACENGHLEIVRWLDEHRTEGCTNKAMAKAAANGHLKIVQWLHERQRGCKRKAMDWAARNGHLEVVQWLHANRLEGCTTNAMDGAASKGHLEIVKWLHENRSEGCTTEAMDWAAVNGHVEAVQWLHENRTEGCTVLAMDRTSSLRMLQWLHENRTEGCTHSATENAVLLGHFEKLLFLHEKNMIVVTEESATNAWKSTNFEIVQWLRANYPEHMDMNRIGYINKMAEDAREMFLQSQGEK